MNTWRDPAQRDDKGPDHPAREFGHEPLIFHMTYRGPETEQETILRLWLKVQNKGKGSFAASTDSHGTIKVTKVGERLYNVVIRERGKEVRSYDESDDARALS